MKEFIYFFRHKNLPGVKIGRASGESVADRFMSFKTYSPFGAEVIGFFECNDCIKIEKILHRRFSAVRMNGEFFDISEDMAKSVISEYETDELKSIKRVFNEWIADPKNNTDVLKKLFSKANDTITDNVDYFIKTHIEPGTETDLLLSTQDICKMFDVDFGFRISHRLTAKGFKSGRIRTENQNKRGFYIKIIEKPNS